MSLLKGTGGVEEVKIKCVARIPTGEVNRFSEVKFVGIFRHPGSKNEVQQIREQLVDLESDYGDDELVEAFFLRFEGMPGPEGGTVECSDEAKEEALANQYYFRSIALGAAEAVFGKEGGRKN